MHYLPDIWNNQISKVLRFYNKKLRNAERHIFVTTNCMLTFGISEKYLTRPVCHMDESPTSYLLIQIIKLLHPSRIHLVPKHYSLRLRSNAFRYEILSLLMHKHLVHQLAESILAIQFLGHLL